MKWIDVKHYLPGNREWEHDTIVVFLSNSEKHFLSNRDICGTWLSRDGKTEERVTHWMILETPPYQWEVKQETNIC